MCCRASHRTSTSISGAFIQLTICRVLSSPVPGKACHAFALRSRICCHDISPNAFSEACGNGAPNAIIQWIKGCSRTRLKRCQSASPRAGENPCVDWSCACVKSSHEKRCSKRCACQSVRQPDSPNPSMLNTCLELSHVNRAKNCSIHSGEA